MTPGRHHDPQDVAAIERLRRQQASPDSHDAAEEVIAA
jgi:hypothetical protein